MRMTPKSSVETHGPDGVGDVWPYSFSRPSIAKRAKMFYIGRNHSPHIHIGTPHKEAAGLANSILLAEDFDDLRKIMCEMLEHHGFTVIEASNGKEAVEKAISERPDIILMDIAMPEMNGIE